MLLRDENPLHRQAIRRDLKAETFRQFLHLDFGFPLDIRSVEDGDSLAGLQLVASTDIKAGALVLRECPLSMALDDPYVADYCGTCAARLSAAEKKTWLARSRNDSRSVLCEDCASNNYLVDLNNFFFASDISFHSAHGGDNRHRSKESSQDDETTGLYRIFFRLFLNYASARAGQLDDDVINMDLGAACMLAYDKSGIEADLLRDIESTSSLIHQLLTRDSSPFTQSHIEQLCQILICNQHVLSDDDRNLEIGRSLYPVAALFNHSCAPNIEWKAGTGTRAVMECFAARDIKRGEPLSICYVSPNQLALAGCAYERRQLLLKKLHFLCCCEECSGFCEVCKGSTRATAKCSRCNSTWYCNRDCQLLDWKRHKSQCDIQRQKKLSLGEG